MRKIGIILIIFSIGNFLVMLAAIASDASSKHIMDKLSQVILLGVLGAIFYYGGNKKKEKTSSSNTESNTKSNEINSDIEQYRQDNIDKYNAIENVTGCKLTSLSETDAKETIQSMERWAKQLNCSISEIKLNVMPLFWKTFNNDDIHEVLLHMKNNKLKEEAHLFNISEKNTCTFYFIKWIEEYLKKEEEKKEEKPSFKAYNRMTAKELILKENSEIEFIENPKKEGQLFFVCGSITGYVSPAIVEKISTIKLEEISYAEVSKNGAEPIPCLMIEKKHKAVRTINLDNPQPILKTGEFDNLSINNFLGCMPGVSTEEKVIETLQIKNMEFKEYPSYGSKDEKDIVLTFTTGYVNWKSRLSIKEGLLKSIALYYYHPNCYKTYLKICEELSERYKDTHDIKFFKSKSEGTEKMVISDKKDAFKFTEIEYDSSLILGQKNVYIRYF